MDKRVLFLLLAVLAMGCPGGGGGGGSSKGVLTTVSNFSADSDYLFTSGDETPQDVIIPETKNEVTSPIPEPATALLFGIGTGAAALLTRKKR